MIIMRLTLIKLLLFLFILSLAPALVHGETLRVGMYLKWPPMSFISARGQLVGFEVEYMQALAQKMGVRIQIIPCRWEEAFSELTRKHYDLLLASVNITNERKDQFDFTDSYLTISQALVVGAASRDVAGPEQLRGKRVGSLSNSMGSDLASLYGARVINFHEIDRAMADVSDYHLDAVICDSPAADYYVKADPNLAGRLKIAAYFKENVQLGMAVNKGNTRLLDRLNQAIKDVRAAGIDEELLRKWWGEKPAS
jgi:polar amino acid transport system substrate-binding protein